MFFRLPKNTIKNLHFGPFGGGYPLPPPPPLNTASAYDFFIKSSIFIKKTFNIIYLFFIFLFWAGLGTAEGSHPPDVSEGVERNVIARGDVIIVSFGLLERECFDEI